MTPAINAWTGATINPIEPEPGVDGRAFIAYKVTGPVAGVWHYEYAIYNQNLDRGIQSFSVPLGVGITVSNLGFHAPLNHPGIANDGTSGDAGFSNAAWTSNQTASDLSWSSETFAQNQNANAVRWGTLYNFRFDSDRPPQAANATIGFFKTGTPMTVGIQGPSRMVDDTDANPTPTPTPHRLQRPHLHRHRHRPPSLRRPQRPHLPKSDTGGASGQPLHSDASGHWGQRWDRGLHHYGKRAEKVLIRGYRTFLSDFGVVNVLADPVLELHGPGAFVTITNNNWRDDPRRPRSRPMGFRRPMIWNQRSDATLDPGAYTAIVRGQWQHRRGVAWWKCTTWIRRLCRNWAILARARSPDGNRHRDCGLHAGGTAGATTESSCAGWVPVSLRSGVPNAMANPTWSCATPLERCLSPITTGRITQRKPREITAAGLAPGDDLGGSHSGDIVAGSLHGAAGGTERRHWHRVWWKSTAIWGNGNGTPSPTPGGTATPTATVAIYTDSLRTYSNSYCYGANPPTPSSTGSPTPSPSATASHLWPQGRFH